MTIPNTRSPGLADVIAYALERFGYSLHSSMPGIVQEYDAATQTAKVQPVLRMKIPTAGTTADAQIQPIVYRVPVVFPGSGLWRLTFPVSPGDQVLLVFADRSIDQWKATGVEGDPIANGTHQLADAVAIVGLVPPFGPRAATSLNTVSIGSDGGVTIEIATGRVDIATAPGATVNVGTGAGSTVNVGGATSQVNLGLGALLVARVGDTVQAGPFAGVITATTQTQTKA